MSVLKRVGPVHKLQRFLANHGFEGERLQVGPFALDAGEGSLRLSSVELSSKSWTLKISEKDVRVHGPNFRYEVGRHSPNVIQCDLRERSDRLVAEIQSLLEAMRKEQVIDVHHKD